MPRPQGFCIFCRGTDLTKEHIIADWTAQYLPKNVPSHTKTSLRIDEPSLVETVQRSAKKIDGDPRSRKIRKVCKSCNGGWMRKQQDLAKPIAAPMIQGQKVCLSSANQKTLAIWILMTIMVSEFSDEEFGAIPLADRQFLKAMQSPPSNWKILLGHYPHGIRVPYLHHESAALNLHGAPIDNEALNTQATTYTVGHVYVHAVSSVDPKFVAGVHANPRENRLVQIWPVLSDLRTWPETLSLSHAEANGIPGTLYRYAVELNRRQ